ncbi:conserved Plasmodium protein, unknown function [Plasmodium vivax]|uniref:Uncharacterized protein n=1 Tax=Plasmodium vivax TaxID=5855 RepID=A0A1G4GTX7_PLAVI|nr:conserved Plasmodium protein, unknown function [Plasmodium vivax]
MVDVYKKPKNMSIGMYYGKDYVGRRRNNNYYGYSNKYRGYNYYYKLHNYRKGNHYEAQQGEVAAQHKEEVPVGDPAKEANGPGKVEGKEEGKAEGKAESKTEGKKRKAEKETEKDEVESRDKKKETGRKKCIIKILKRPIEAASNEEGKGKGAMEEAEQKEQQKEQQKKKKKEKAKENEREGAKDCVEQKIKKKKEGEGASGKAKKVKDGFKFTSTQELFNLLLKDVKNNSHDEEEEEKEEEMAKPAEKKGATTSVDPAKGPSEGPKMESENENAKKITKRSKPDLSKKGATSAAGVKENQPARNDDPAQQNNHEEEKAAKESEPGKSIKGKEASNSGDAPKSDKITEAEEKCPNGASKNGGAAQSTKATGASGHVKESASTVKAKESSNAVKGKKGLACGSNKYYYQMNLGSNISRGRKIIKMMRNAENGKYYYPGSRKDLAAGADGYAGGVAGHYVKYATSKYPNFTTSCSLLNHATKMELCKHNSLNSSLLNNLSGGMCAGQRNEDCRRAGKKEEEEGFFAVPIYMRSPKPEQIPIPVYLSGGADQVPAQERAQEVLGVQATGEAANEAVIEAVNEAVNEAGIETTNEATAEAPPQTANLQGRKSKGKGQPKSAKGAPNGNAHNNRESQNAQNFTKKNVEKKKKNKAFLNKNYMMPFNQEQQSHANKHSYDFLNAGNVKSSNKVYNVHSLHASYVKGANYNGCNLHGSGSGKNVKMEKYFHNKRYKVKAYLSDNNQRSKNLNPLKEVKIAVY